MKAFVSTIDIPPQNLYEWPRAANFCAYKGGFRLNAKQCEGTFVGSQHNVDLDAAKQADIILDLLKLAEEIYVPPEAD